MSYYEDYKHSTLEDLDYTNLMKYIVEMKKTEKDFVEQLESLLYQIKDVGIISISKSDMKDVTLEDINKYIDDTYGNLVQTCKSYCDKMEELSMETKYIGTLYSVV